MAQAVLRGRTSGYLHHPQLGRFRAQLHPQDAIAAYLRTVHTETARRGYAFAARKIGSARGSGVITVARGRLMHEWNHLMAKLAIRDPELRDRLELVRRPQPHPLFRIVPGGIEAWEKGPQRRPDDRFH